jgi:hypothetical protein
MLQEDIVLVDAPLIADPDATQEMSSAVVELIADEELRGCRLLIVRKMIESVAINGVPGGVIQLGCTFQPAVGLRFVSARVMLRLTTPKGLQVIDLSPSHVADPAPVEFTLGKKGNISLKALLGEPGIEMEVSKKYTKYHCQIQGAGIGTSLARWEFKENPDRNDGLGPEQVLALTLPTTGQVAADLIVNARVERAGLAGYAQAIGDLIIGGPTINHSYSILLDIPLASTPSAVSRFFTLFE